jgi:DNA-binding CsgD family transcriptional regulator
MVRAPKKSTRKKKPRAKGKHYGKQLTPIEQEIVRQTYLVTGNMAETGRQLDLDSRTVAKYVKNQTDPEMDAARRRSALSLAGQVQTRAVEIIDSIGPDDLESGYLRDEQGEYIKDRNGRPIFLGPTLNQKVLSAAILTDKLPVLESYRKSIGEDAHQGLMITPETVRGLVDGIKTKIKNISVLNVEFAEDALASRAEKLMDQAQEAIQAEEEFENADYEILDFDN